MNFTQRLFFFIIGIVLGSLIVSHIMKQRRIAAGEEQAAAVEIAPVGTEAVQRSAVAGIMRAYNSRRVPMQSEFIHSEIFIDAPAAPVKTDAPAAPDKTERYLLLRGREAEQMLGIRELMQKDADRVWGRVEAVRIFAADRLQVRLSPGATREQLQAQIAPLGMRVIRGLPADSEDPSAPLAVTIDKGVRMETAGDTADTDLLLVGFAAEGADSVLKAQEALGKLAAVASVSLDYLDAGHPYTGAETK